MLNVHFYHGGYKQTSRMAMFTKVFNVLHTTLMGERGRSTSLKHGHPHHIQLTLLFD